MLRDPVGAGTGNAKSTRKPSNTKDELKSIELVLQARSLIERPFHYDVLATAADLLDEAISLNPNNAQAHSERGHTYSLMSTYLREGDKTEFINKATHGAACSGD